jgi:CheY-like chemotaxis protein
MSQEPPKILVVDDDLDTCQNLKDILTEMGYAVTTAQSGEAALELVRQNPFDVALLDFKMPGARGDGRIVRATGLPGDSAAR